MSEDEMKKNKEEEKCIGDGPLAQLFQSFYCKIIMHQNMYNNGGEGSNMLKIYIIMDLLINIAIYYCPNLKS